MKYRLVDILACPMCKNFPLRLLVFRVDKRYNPVNIVKCELYCSYHDGMINNIPETKCKECYTFEILEGALICGKCGRWYPIIDEIPIMLPDDLRDKRRDMEFLERWKEKLSWLHGFDEASSSKAINFDHR